MSFSFVILTYLFGNLKYLSTWLLHLVIEEKGSDIGKILVSKILGFHLYNPEISKLDSLTVTDLELSKYKT